MKTTGLPERPPFGNLQCVQNVDPKFGAAGHYHRVLVYDPESAEFITLLLTDGDLTRQARRRLRNPEEVIEPGFIDKLKANA